MSTQLRDLFDAALTEEPLAGPTLDDDVARGRQARRRRRARRGVGVATMAGVFITGALVIPASPFAVVDANTTFAGVTSAPSIGVDCTTRTDADPPRIVAGEDNWKVDVAFEHSPDAGSIDFRNGTQEIDMTWMGSHEFENHVDDMRSDPLPEYVDEGGVAFGCTATVIHHGGDSYKAFVPVGDHGVVISSREISAADFEEFLEELRIVDEQAWLAAMPDDFVRAPDPEIVANMVADIPVPDGIAREYLGAGEDGSDRYELGRQVVKRVMCEWMSQWFSAEKENDDEAAADVADALATARDWSILEEMDPQGDYPEVVWAYADAVASGSHTVDGQPLDLDQTPVDLQCVAVAQ